MGRVLEHAGRYAGDPPGHVLVPEFGDGDRIVELDENRRGASDWFADLPRIWLAVPLNHLGDLLGFVVLARSRAPFKLDREVFDLLRVVGREVASRVAEQRAVAGPVADPRSCASTASASPSSCTTSRTSPGSFPCC